MLKEHKKRIFHFSLQPNGVVSFKFIEFFFEYFINKFLTVFFTCFCNKLQARHSTLGQKLKNVFTFMRESQRRNNGTFLRYFFKIREETFFNCNAFQYVFPNIEIRQCLFHLGQSIHRHIQKKGLTPGVGESDFFLNGTVAEVKAFTEAEAKNWRKSV